MTAKGNAMNEESIFITALEQPREARQAFVEQACADDLQQRERIQRLLAAHENAAAQFMGEPAGKLSPTPDQPPPERVGTQIGPYKLLQQIGEGGMGVVYMAEQTEPVKRRVAVKIIKPGMDTQQVIARFEAERQALSLMDHPNIARVLDAGCVARDSVAGDPSRSDGLLGRPYFVMELVKGVPITQYCDEKHLTPRQRLELLLPVCQAIQHAHQKGIIHRDIKPTNILVAEYDNQPVPKVIDFGVAKATSQTLTEKTMFTGLGQIVGTLEYMSPEQAKVNQLDIDTRSDIYSLGVLLYELLSGSTPFDKTRLRSAAWDEMLRIIREEEPEKPSTRLSSADTLPSIAANRNMEPARLGRTVRGELDWIVMKALEKDRNRRYETANGLAMELQRYLADEPVQACPPSAGYRLRKFVRRNKRPVLAASLVVLALVGGIIGTTFGLIRAEQQRVVVERQRNELAERNQALEAAHERERLLNERARQAIESLTSDTAIEQLTREQELSQEQKDFLDKMILYYAESIQEGAANEQERLRQARAYFRMGRLNQVLGRSQDSENAYRRAVTLFKQLAADFPTRPEFQQELASSHNALGVLLLATGRSPGAELAYADALAIWKPLAANFPTRPEFRQALAGIYNNQGNVLGDTGRLAEAELAHVQALAIRKQLATDFPTRPIIRRALAMSHNNLGWLFQSTERLEKAESSYADAVAAQKLAVADFPNRPEFRMELAKYLCNLGNLLRDGGRLKEAEAIYGEAMPIQKQLVSDFPNRPVFRQELAGGHNKLGILFRNTERLPEAEAAYGEALAINKQLVAEFPDVPEYRNDAAGTLFNLASAANRRQDFDTARKLVDEAIPYHLAALKANPRHIDYRAGYRNSLVELTQSCAGLGDRPAALAAATKRRDLGWDSAVDAYEAACMLALCVTIVGKDDKLVAAKRQDETQFYADQAIAMLRDAVGKGFQNVDLLKQDKYIGAIREHEEFKKVVAELEAKMKN